MISRGITKAKGMGRLWPGLLAVTLLPASYSLLAQEALGNRHWNRDTGTVPISIGSFTLSPKNAPALVLDDSGAERGKGIRSTSIPQTVPAARHGQQTIRVSRPPASITSPHSVRIALPRPDPAVVRQWFWMRAPARPGKRGIRC